MMSKKDFDDIDVEVPAVKPKVESAKEPEETKTNEPRSDWESMVDTWVRAAYVASKIKEFESKPELKLKSVSKTDCNHPVENIHIHEPEPRKHGMVKFSVKCMLCGLATVVSMPDYAVDGIPKDWVVHKLAEELRKKSAKMPHWFKTDCIPSVESIHVHEPELHKHGMAKFSVVFDESKEKPMRASVSDKLEYVELAHRYGTMSEDTYKKRVEKLMLERDIQLLNDLYSQGHINFDEYVDKLRNLLL